jgi:hypothetical protein
VLIQPRKMEIYSLKFAKIKIVHYTRTAVRGIRETQIVFLDASLNIIMFISYMYAWLFEGKRVENKKIKNN